MAFKELGSNFGLVLPTTEAVTKVSADLLIVGKVLSG